MTQSMTMIMRTLTTNYQDIGWQLIIFHEKKIARTTKKIIWFLSQLIMQQVESSKNKKNSATMWVYTFTPLIIYNSPRDKL